MPPIAFDYSPAIVVELRRWASVKNHHALSRRGLLPINAFQRLRQPLQIGLVTGNDDGNVSQWFYSRYHFT
jgi:hypothetical protein